MSPPPFFTATKGNLQMFPSPTLILMQLIKKSSGLSNFSRSVSESVSASPEYKRSYIEIDGHTKYIMIYLIMVRVKS